MAQRDQTTLTSRYRLQALACLAVAARAQETTPLVVYDKSSSKFVGCWDKQAALTIDREHCSLLPSDCVSRPSHSMRSASVWHLLGHIRVTTNEPRTVPLAVLPICLRACLLFGLSALRARLASWPGSSVLAQNLSALITLIPRTTHLDECCDSLPLSAGRHLR